MIQGTLLSDLPDPRTEPAPPASLALQADSLPTEPPGKPIITQQCSPENRIEALIPNVIIFEDGDW